MSPSPRLDHALRQRHPLPRESPHPLLEHGCEHEALWCPHLRSAPSPLLSPSWPSHFAMDSFARRRASVAPDAGLYASVILLSSFGIFVFTRITIPDVMVCLWLTLALFCYWLMELFKPNLTGLLCYAFATCCALNVLTKGLIGIVFPIDDRAFHTCFSHEASRSDPPTPSPIPSHHQLPHLPRHRRALAHPHRPRQPNPRPSRKPELHSRPLDEFQNRTRATSTVGSGSTSSTSIFSAISTSASRATTTLFHSPCSGVSYWSGSCLGQPSS